MTETAQLARIDDMTRLPEARLVGLARARSEAAVREIVRRYNQRLFRAARSITRNDADAEDVVQAGYVRAFTHLDTFRGESALSTWLTRIVLNEALGRVRRRRETTGLEAIEAAQANGGAEIIQFPLLQDHPDPETAMSRLEVRELLEQAIDSLPEAFRAVFVLRDVEGLSAEETAEQLEIKPETVNTRLFRARRQLREKLADQLGSTLSGLFPFDGERCVHMADRVVADLKRDGTLG
jgi:RNA polymerase sigma-70 factor (ECF subfamily)